MPVPIQMGINMTAGNQQKHLSLSFATKASHNLSRNSKTLKYTFSDTRTVQIAKLTAFSPQWKIVKKVVISMFM